MSYLDCPNAKEGEYHRVKWNSGDPWCLTCNVPAVLVEHQTHESE